MSCWLLKRGSIAASAGTMRGSVTAFSRRDNESTEMFVAWKRSKEVRLYLPRGPFSFVKTVESPTNYCFDSVKKAEGRESFRHSVSTWRESIGISGTCTIVWFVSNEFDSIVKILNARIRRQCSWYPSVVLVVHVYTNGDISFSRANSILLEDRRAL